MAQAVEPHVTAAQVDSIAAFCQQQADAGRASGWPAARGWCQEDFTSFAGFMRSCHAEAATKQQEKK
jgi:hypothetical protein